MACKCKKCKCGKEDEALLLGPVKNPTSDTYKCESCGAPIPWGVSLLCPSCSSSYEDKSK